jgi:hypothetical protein
MQRRAADYGASSAAQDSAQNSGQATLSNPSSGAGIPQPNALANQDAGATNDTDMIDNHECMFMQSNEQTYQDDTVPSRQDQPDGGEPDDFCT